ncbi:MAG: hypothetical protein ABSG07_05050 [Terriglobales bacterium]|jgi:hypothetical protein
MTKSSLFRVLAFMAIVAFFVCGQQALAEIRVQVLTNPGHETGVKTQSLAKYDELFQLSAGFGTLPPIDGGGNDEWPCFPNMNANGADCSQIATGGVVIGSPAFTWSYADCDANSASSPNCGQIFWFYEDDTGDNTDDLIVSIVVKQGTDYILDTGKYNFGPNPFSPGTVVVISDDVAFGTLGQTGKNNGFCDGSNKTCVNPLQGIATVTVTTQVGPSKISTKFNINLQ